MSTMQTSQKQQSCAGAQQHDPQSGMAQPSVESDSHDCCIHCSSLDLVLPRCACLNAGTFVRPHAIAQYLRLQRGQDDCAEDLSTLEVLPAVEPLALCPATYSNVMRSCQLSFTNHLIGHFTTLWLAMQKA